MPETQPRRRALIGLVLIVLAFGILGNSHGITEPSGLDRSIHDWVVRNRRDWPRLTVLFRYATRFGDPDVATPATLGVAIGIILLSRRGVAGLNLSEALVWLATIVSGRFVGNVLKWVYQRARPPVAGRLVPETNSSFPSIHSTFATIFFTMLAILIVRSIPAARVGLRLLAAGVCAMLALVVGASRVWLGVHYPTDIVGGWLLGIGWVLTVWLVRSGSGRWETGHRAGMIPQQPGDRSPT
jgi:undecaprenyl-diphosphatase